MEARKCASYFFWENQMSNDDKIFLGCAGSGIALIVATIAAFATHLFWVFGILMRDSGLTIGQAILALIGTFIPPIGAFHGLYLWIM